MNQRLYISCILGTIALGCFSSVKSIVKNLKTEIKTHSNLNCLSFWMLNAICFFLWNGNCFCVLNRVRLALQIKQHGLVSNALEKITENPSKFIATSSSIIISPWSFMACLWEIFNRKNLSESIGIDDLALQ